MRNKFVYSCSIKIRAWGFNELLESIFCILLVVGAFSLQKIVEMLEEVVVGGQEVMWIWQMRWNFVAQFVELLKRWLCSWALPGRRTGPFLLTNTGCRCYSVQCNSSICWAYFLVSLGFRNGFPGIQKAVVDQTSSRPPNSNHVWSFSVQPLSWSSLVVI